MIIKFEFQIIAKHTNILQRMYDCQISIQISITTYLHNKLIVKQILQILLIIIQKMSLFIVGSVSRITSNIILQLSKNKQYSAITVLDPLPSYEYHHRFYRLQQQIENAQYSTKVSLDRSTDINDLRKGQNYDDVMYITHDYYTNVVSKTKLMELTAQAFAKRKYLYFATPMEYDHYGFYNPQANYLEAEKKVMKINPNSTIIRSDVQDKTQTLAYFNAPKKNYLEKRVFESNFHFSPKIVSVSQYAQTVCDVLSKKIQGKRIIVRGNEVKNAVYGDFDQTIGQSQFGHAKDNIVNLAQKYNAVHFKDYEELPQAQ